MFRLSSYLKISNVFQLIVIDFLIGNWSKMNELIKNLIEIFGKCYLHRIFC